MPLVKTKAAKVQSANQIQRVNKALTMPVYVSVTVHTFAG
jgi:hypothetical protein